MLVILSDALINTSPRTAPLTGLTPELPAHSNFYDSLAHICLKTLTGREGGPFRQPGVYTI